MELIYNVLDTLLPFAWMEYTFMKNALLAILLMTPLFGLLSTMVVSSRMAFFSDSLGHGAFTGIAIGALVGAFAPLTSLIIFSVLFALLITWIKHRTAASADTVIGVFSSTAIAVGLMIMSHGGGFSKFSPLLIGDILSITPVDLGGLLAVDTIVLLGWVLLFNRLLLLSVNPSLARSRGVSVVAVESMFGSCEHPVGRHSHHQRAARPAGSCRTQSCTERQGVSSFCGDDRTVFRDDWAFFGVLSRHCRRSGNRGIGSRNFLFVACCPCAFSTLTVCYFRFFYARMKMVSMRKGGRSP